MLKYRPKDGIFAYNAEHPFPQESIIVIDEASMIDIGLFARLLEAIPQGRACSSSATRTSSLPWMRAPCSVNFCAKKESVVALTESLPLHCRFSIGRLARAVNAADSAKNGTRRSHFAVGRRRFPVESALQEDAVDFFELPAEFKSEGERGSETCEKVGRVLCGISDVAEKKSPRKPQGGLR